MGLARALAGDWAPWIVLAAGVLSLLARAADMESWALFIPGGLIGRAEHAFGPRAAPVTAAAMLVERRRRGRPGRRVEGAGVDDGGDRAREHGADPGLLGRVAHRAGAHDPRLDVDVVGVVLGGDHFGAGQAHQGAGGGVAEVADGLTALAVSDAMADVRDGGLDDGAAQIAAELADLGAAQGRSDADAALSDEDTAERKG